MKNEADNQGALLVGNLFSFWLFFFFLFLLRNDTDSGFDGVSFGSRPFVVRWLLI